LFMGTAQGASTLWSRKCTKQGERKEAMIPRENGVQGPGTVVSHEVKSVNFCQQTSKSRRERRKAPLRG